MVTSRSYLLGILFPLSLLVIPHEKGMQPRIGLQKIDTTSSLVAEGATPRLISSQFSFTEGPAVDKFGNIFFTDQPNDKIWKFDIRGELSVFLDKTGRSNGMYFDKKGNLITAADENNQFWSISPDKKVTVLLDNYNGQRFNGPNDLWIDKKGGIFFTDPYYQRPYWQRKKPDMADERLYYLPKGKKAAVVVDSNLVRPNGIIGSADGKNLFVSDINDRKTYKYDISKNGNLKNRRLFVSMGSDGMTLDNKGNLYLTGQGVTVFDPDGKKILNIPLPGWTANVCFGGINRDLLFITSSKSVYTLQMNVKGIN
ncbi:SMP-30/gluconolactonase/LRE family protein [Daejeonella lutea]|uniref:Gluconolactonase n=1 Tax=Daejeonella lutea TaxID=572036 RepID=A0A1T5DT70_9SPHI|nr:SMP-30/gluconolactonase/LRE family protein [Daejeonella lutea]SKB75022.1 gluconolactonase [Daejeonella lutea]